MSAGKPVPKAREAVPSGVQPQQGGAVALAVRLDAEEARALELLATWLSVRAADRIAALHCTQGEEPERLAAAMVSAAVRLRQELASGGRARPAKPVPVAWTLEGWITARGQFFASKAAMPRHEQETARAVFSMSSVGKPRSGKPGGEG